MILDVALGAGPHPAPGAVPGDPPAGLAGPERISSVMPGGKPVRSD